MIKDGKRTAVPFAEILQLELQKAGEAQPAGPITDVELSDGSLLHCKKVTFKGKQAQLTLAGADATFDIPLQSISYILNGAQDGPVRQEWEEKVLSKRGNQDQVVIRRDNALNALGGTLGDGAANGQIEFTLEVGGERRTARSRPRARARAGLPTNGACRVGESPLQGF